MADHVRNRHTYSCGYDTHMVWNGEIVTIAAHETYTFSRVRSGKPQNFDKTGKATTDHHPHTVTVGPAVGREAGNVLVASLLSCVGASGSVVADGENVIAMPWIF